MTELRQVGLGVSVMEIDEAIEGPTLFLDSPEQVLEFIAGDDVESTIVVSRGGTTTFIGPDLTVGVRGLITLQGAPESHLGILSREYGISCIMSVAFSDEVATDRGEIIPAVGTLVRLDVSSGSQGRVLAAASAVSA